MPAISGVWPATAQMVADFTTFGLIAEEIAETGADASQ
jgi:hypothetical protein